MSPDFLVKSNRKMVENVDKSFQNEVLKVELNQNNACQEQIEDLTKEKRLINDLITVLEATESHRGHIFLRKEILEKEVLFKKIQDKTLFFIIQKHEKIAKILILINFNAFLTLAM